MKAPSPRLSTLTLVNLTSIILVLASGFVRAQSSPMSSPRNFPSEPASAPGGATQDSTLVLPESTRVLPDSVSTAGNAPRDTTLASPADSLAVASSLPDTVWVLRLGGRIATLDSTLALRDRLQEEGIAAFTRIRASSSAYWYEIFAGPAASRAEIDTMSTTVGKLGWFESLEPERAYLADVLLGEVGPQLPPGPSGPGTGPGSPSATDPRRGAPDR